MLKVSSIFVKTPYKDQLQTLVPRFKKLFSTKDIKNVSILKNVPKNSGPNIKLMKPTVQKEDKRVEASIEKTTKLIEKKLKSQLEMEKNLKEDFTQKHNFIWDNSLFRDYFENMKKLHYFGFKKVYEESLKNLLVREISSLENQISHLKDKIQSGDLKIQNLKVPSQDESKLSEGSFTKTAKDIFTSSSIKELENRLNTLPISTLNDAEFQYKTLDFYSERNIDKAFEYFYDNLRIEELTSENYVYLSNFLNRLFLLDRVPYLNVLVDFIINNKIVLSKLLSLNPESQKNFKKFINYHLINNYDYKNTIVALKYVLLNDDIKYENNIEEVFNYIADEKFETRRLEVNNDEVLKLLEIYTHSQLKLFKSQSIVKVLSMTFDNTQPIENQNIFDMIMSLSKKQPEIMPLFKESLTAYHEYFGFPPIVFSGNNLKSTYLNYRSRISNISINEPQIILREDELEVFVQLFKSNLQPHYVADIITNWKHFSKVDENESRAYKLCLSDYILSSELHSGNNYHKKIEEIFPKNVVNRTLQIDQLVLTTLAYLKDGNKSFAVENFLEKVSTTMQNIRTNDAELAKLYDTAFGILEAESSETSSEKNYHERVEFEYNLKKVKLVENCKNILTQLFQSLKVESSNKLQCQEKLVNIIKKTKFTKDNEEYGNLVKELNTNFEKLSKLNLEQIADELKLIENSGETQLSLSEKLQDINAKIKVALYNDEEKFDVLSTILKIDLKFANDLQRVEFDQGEKEKHLKNLKEALKDLTFKPHHEFIKLVETYFSLKPVSYSKVLFLHESSLRAMVDPDLYYPSKVKSYVDSAMKYYRDMRNKYSQNPKILNELKIFDNIGFLESIGINIKKVLSNNQKNKLDDMVSLLNNYKSLLNNLNKKSRSRQMTNIPFNRFARTSFFSSFKTLINLNNPSNDLIQESNRTMQFVNRYHYYHSITLNKVKDHRKRNTIKALYTYWSKNHRLPLLNSRINKVSLQKSTNNMMLNVFKSLKKLNSEINPDEKHEDNIYIESVFNDLCKKHEIKFEEKTTDQNIQSSGQVSTAAKVKTMKELLGQEQQIFTLPHAIYMILFGTQNNIPEAVRLAEKVCSDLGYVLPSWVETKVNKYLVSFPNNYASTVEKIGPVNAASIYKPDMDTQALYDHGKIKTPNDKYKSSSIWAVDHLPFKGAEEVVDIKKLTLILRGLNSKAHFYSLNNKI
jgi:hypothetical protein